jgi:hypothetical protein
VCPHRQITAVPIDPAFDGHPGLEKLRVGDDVKDLPSGPQGVAHVYLPTVVPDDPDVTGLSPSPGVEDSAVQDDPFGEDFQYLAFCGGGVRVSTCELVSHGIDGNQRARSSE